MPKDNPLFDDLARMASGATGAFMDMKREMETMVQAQVEKFMNRMQFVSWEEFEAVRDMAVKAREENEALKERIDALEKKQSGSAKSASKSSTKKS
ncbi:MAG: hypothetical protein CMM94_05045 [Rickettsiales bacterium]|nr:hypothetical protein [Rickettsiales bacterium]|tara:strand:+ start:825 stop:1112 length:288 start_codon:yes stop_codon:yes gene_type:complete